MNLGLRKYKMMNERQHPSVDATIRKYLIEKVREKFRDDFYLLEPVIEDFVTRYSLKELLMICSVEINRRKNNSRQGGGRPEF
jgi:hypothetical protein